MKDDLLTFFKNLLLLIAVVIGVLFLCMLTGCTTQRKIERFYQKHPDKEAAHFAKRFLVRESVDSSEYKRTKSELDSVLSCWHSLPAEQHQLTNELRFPVKTSTVNDPGFAPKINMPAEISARTNAEPNYTAYLSKIRQAVSNLKPVVIKQRDSAGMAVLHYRIAALEKAIEAKDKAYLRQRDKLEQVKEGRNRYLWWFTILAVLVVLYVLLKVKRFVP